MPMQNNTTSSYKRNKHYLHLNMRYNICFSKYRNDFILIYFMNYYIHEFYYYLLYYMKYALLHSGNQR